jgi:hypothetical protein
VADTNFVIIPAPDPAVVLWDSFPELREQLEETDMGAYYLYDRFAEHLISRSQDSLLWRRAYEFFESLANGHANLQDLLVIGIFETMSTDRELIARLEKNLGPGALGHLKQLLGS